jgi:hypothetical protein
VVGDRDEVDTGRARSSNDLCRIVPLTVDMQVDFEPPVAGGSGRSELFQSFKCR